MNRKLLPALVALTFTVHESFAESSPPSTEPEVQVPFGCGYAFPVSQTHNTGSHLQNDTWAWDFRMPEGTPVVAARDGVVRVARGDSREGGCDPKFAPFANYVVVDHGDGFETQYLHFSEVVVRPGQRVKAGALLGYSGKTGWACGAHLHFKVARYVGAGWNNPSVPAKLAGFGDPELESTVSGPSCGADRAYLASRGPHLGADDTARAELASAVQAEPVSAPPSTNGAAKPDSKSVVPSLLKSVDSARSAAPHVAAGAME